MLVVVPNADVGALGDDVHELCGVRVHPGIVWRVHERSVPIVERRTERFSERIRTTPTPSLMCDHAVDTLAVERNGPVELAQQISVVLLQVLRTDAAYFLTLGEYVVRRDISVDHVHEQRNPRPIIGTKRRPVGLPLGRRLGDLVGAILAVHCVDVSDEQGAVLVCGSKVDVDVAAAVHLGGCPKGCLFDQPLG